jgi:hypothetical protein
MTQILKLPKLKKIDGMPQVQIRRRGIYAQFDPQSPLFS